MIASLLSTYPILLGRRLPGILGGITGCYLFIMLSDGKFAPIDLYAGALVVISSLAHYCVTIVLVNIEPVNKDAVTMFLRNSVLFIAMAIGSAAVLVAFK